MEPSREEHDRADALIATGNDFEDTGHLPQALKCYQTAVSIAPKFAKAHLNMGNLLRQMGDTAQALAAYDRALQLDPGYAAAHYNKGNVFAELRRFQEAIAAYRRALVSRPNFVDAFIALGNAYLELDDSINAAANYRRAIEIDPTHAHAHGNLGNALQRSRDGAGAIRAYRAALALDGRLGSALAQSYILEGQRADWANRSADEKALVELIAKGAGDVPPFVTLLIEADGVNPAELQKQAGRQFAERQYGPLIESARPTIFNRNANDARLRIGYISADFRQHAVMHLVEGVLAAHDRSKLSVTCYSTGKVVDQITHRISDGCERFVHLARAPDPEAAAMIRNDEIQILVDLQGYTTDARIELVARRPAPLIVNWIGYPASIGHPRLADYIIADRIVAPAGHERYFSETLALMPHSYIPTDDRWQLGRGPSRGDEGLPDGHIVFCSFNQAVKLNPATFDLWCRILRAVDGSVLWLLFENDEAKLNLRREAAARGITSDRLVFAARVSPAAHFDRLQLADIALDTFPYVSHTTASDALWAGVPIVTKLGQAFASRVAASLLTSVGLPELIAESDQHYFDLCVDLANDRSRLQDMRQTLKATCRNTPAFDTRGFTRNLELLYHLMWHSHLQGRRETITLKHVAPLN